MQESIFLVTLREVSLGLIGSEKSFVQHIISLYDTDRTVPKEVVLKAFAMNALEKEHEDDTQKENEEKCELNFRDRRPVSLLLGGFRRFPYKGKNTYYKLSFTNDENQPLSSIFLGANGIGKSSLYNALEIFYLNHLFSAENRGYKSKEEQNDYIQNQKGTNEEICIKLSINDSWWDYKRNNTPLSYPAFFCSEYDIVRLEDKGTPLKDYIVQQLGFTELLELNNTLKKIESEIDEQPTEEGKKIKNIIEHTYHALNNRLLQYYEEIAKYIQDTVPAILEKWLKEDTRGSITTFVNIEPNKEDKANPFNMEILLWSADDESIAPMNPCLFLNTFRFKLYCVALKLSLACCAKKLWKINAPFVIDDVFDSSDFGNRVGISEFIEQILDAHDKVMQGKENRLQLIFFTQDEIIAESVCKGFAQNERYKDSVKLSTLFSPTESEPADVGRIQMGDDWARAIRIEDKVF